MTNTPNDSGHRAIAGYFYQALLTSGMPVELHEAAHRDRTGDGFELISAVYPEEHGQDAVAIARAGTTVIARVVQHKFSSWPERSSNYLLPSDLFEIIEKLNEAAGRVKARYGCEPRLCLHTNRFLSPQAKEFLEDCKANRANSDLDDTVERIEGTGKEKRVRHEGRSLVKNAFYRRCLEKLEYDVKSVVDAKDALRRRAASFGVLPEEVDDRIKRIESEIIGIMTQAALREITLADLDKWLTGDAYPKEICSPTTVDCMREDIKQVGSYLEPFHPLVLREKQRELSAAKFNPVVLIVGEGGVGKSALVFQYLWSSLKEPPTQYFGACHVRDANAFWCGKLFCDWRQSTNQNLQLSDPERILQRLDLATKDRENPILLLWIDGIDECDDDSTLQSTIRALRSVLRKEKTRCQTTGEAPRLQLILTCRTAKDYELRFGEEDQFNHGHQRVPPIKLEQFTVNEISSLPLSFLPDSVSRRLHDGLINVASSNATAEEEPLVRLGTLKHEDAAPFLHPPLMAALRTVGEIVANDCLDQNHDAMRTVSSKYVTWFAIKACRRFRARDVGHVFRQLVEIEKTTRRIAPPYSMKSHWIDPAVAYGFTSLEAEGLFGEALSAGLIEEEGFRRWRWRNKYVILGIQANDVQEEVVS